MLDDDAVHIPFPTGSFRKAEKINAVIDHNRPVNPDYIGISDADLVIRDEDFDLLVEHMKCFRDDRYYVCEVDDVQEESDIDFLHGEFRTHDLCVKPRERLYTADLGGLFFAPFRAMDRSGVFDERFTVWGGEDNAASFKLQECGLKPTPLLIRPLHLPHESMEASSIASAGYRRQVDILREFQLRLPLDGINSVVDPATLNRCAEIAIDASDETETVRDAVVSIGRFGDNNAETVMSSLVRFFGHEVLQTGGRLHRSDIETAPFFVAALFADSRLNQRVIDLLTYSTARSNTLDGQRLFALVTECYGGRQLAGSQAYAFLAWLCQFGIFECTDEEAQQYRYRAPLQVTESAGSAVLRLLHRSMGSPRLLPLRYFDERVLLDFRPVIDSIKRDRSGAGHPVRAGKIDCIQFSNNRSFE